MYVQFVHSAFGNEGGGLELVYESTSCLAWGVIYDRRRDRGVVCVFSIFNAGGNVCGCRCVYTHTHTRTHTAHKGYSDVSPEVRMRHLQGPRNPDGLNLGIHVFVYVYKVHMCMHMLGGGMRSWTNCFFSLTYFSFRKRKAKHDKSPPKWRKCESFRGMAFVTGNRSGPWIGWIGPAPV